MKMLIAIEAGYTVPEVVEDLKKLGVVVEKTRAITGIISVDAPVTDVDRIFGLPGVAAVEPQGISRPMGDDEKKT